MKETYELAIIGAGPAGLEAAIAAAKSGVSTILIDSSPRPGGQYYKPLPAAFHATKLTAVEKDGADLVSRLEISPVNQLYDAIVWGIFKEENGEGWLLTLNVLGVPKQIHARCLILANGAYDRPMPFPGWTLPGVITCGAALLLIKNQRVAPFRRVLVSGSGPLLLSAAAHLIEAGVEVVQVCESNRINLEAISYAPTLLGEFHRMQEGAGYLAAFVRAHTPYKLGWSIVAAHGNERVKEATIARLNNDGTPIPGTQKTFQVDAIISGFGLTPNTSLPRMLGCKFEYQKDKQTWQPQRGQNLQSSLPGVYLAGDGAGIGGAENARLEGRIAGLAVALETGHASQDEMDSFYKENKPELEQQRRFGQFLAKFLSPQPGLIALPQDDTIVCRCEEITLGEVKAAVAAGARTLGEVKMVTRTGMGNCQGRMCEQSVAGIIVHTLADQMVTPESTGMYSIRPPLIPLPIGFFVEAGKEN